MSFEPAMTWNLNGIPTNRSTLLTHDKTKIYNLHSDEKRLHPTWTKISSSAWDGRAKLCGGYGRKVMRTTISDDAPTYFVNPEYFSQENNNRMTRTSLDASNRSCDIAAVISEGNSKTIAKRPSARSNYRKTPFGNQLVLEPVQKGELVRARDFYVPTVRAKTVL